MLAAKSADISGMPWFQQCLQQSEIENCSSIHSGKIKSINLSTPYLFVTPVINHFVSKNATQLFCWLLSKIDTNNNLSTFPTKYEAKYTTMDSQKASLWITMLKAWKVEHMHGWNSTELTPSIIYSSKFPFSFVFLPQLALTLDAR